MILFLNWTLFSPWLWPGLISQTGAETSGKFVRLQAHAENLTDLLWRILTDFTPLQVGQRY